jgi:hypothetical protein
VRSFPFKLIAPIRFLAPFPSSSPSYLLIHLTHGPPPSPAAVDSGRELYSTDPSNDLSAIVHAFPPFPSALPLLTRCSSPTVSCVALLQIYILLSSSFTKPSSRVKPWSLLLPP